MRRLRGGVCNWQLKGIVVCCSAENCNGENECCDV